MSNRILKNKGTWILAMALGLAPLVVRAEGAPGLNGYYPDSSAACWSKNLGALTNTCATTRELCLPMVLSTTGAKTLKVGLQGPSSGTATFTASAIVRRWDNVGGVSSTPNVTAIAGPPILITLGTVTVPAPAKDYMMYACVEVPPQGKVLSYSW